MLTQNTAPKFTLRQLTIFLAIARTENISRAAEDLSMSQSAASAALLQIEEHYNIPLFIRSGKSLQLSKAGESLRPQAEALIAHAEEFHRAMQGQHNLGHLNVGASLTIGNYLAVEYLAAYLNLYPEASIDYQVASTPEIIEQVLNFDLDIGMIEVDTQHKELDIQPWRHDYLRVFCSKDHPLAHKNTVSDKDLLSAKWILREPGSGARQTFDRAMHDLRANLNVYMELKHNEAIKRAVESGIGIGCLSEIALEVSVKHGDLVMLELPKRQMLRTLYFITRKERYDSLAIKHWIELCSA